MVSRLSAASRFKGLINSLWGNVIGMCLILGIIAFSGYQEMERRGMIPHTTRTSISVPSDWIVGESKACRNHPLATDRHGLKRDYKRGYAFIGLDCADIGTDKKQDAPFKLMEVTFWGREYQRESETIVWDCTRRSDTFECLEFRAFFK